MNFYNLKSEKGITLTTLVVYIIVMLIVVGIMSTISTFFYKNLGIVRDSAKYASEFDKFNSYIVKDVKNNTDFKIDDNIITFEDGTTYVYNAEDEGLYRGKMKIATNVKSFSASKKTIFINSVNKQILTVNIIIGNSSKNLINKQIDYTLKYW